MHYNRKITTVITFVTTQLMEWSTLW